MPALGKFERTEEEQVVAYFKEVDRLWLGKTDKNRQEPESGSRYAGQDSNLWATRWRGWLRHCATNRKFAGSIPD